ncbi:MAG: tryptophan synthase subunit alpha [Oscillospiraceae bacterium]|jgi:tryptophan synthase alpha chain|nr:tryptophan synthase subunit alpha [Oscillospiraceae bacterium]
MSRIASAFNHSKAFIGFVTGGDPTLDKSEEFILEMVRAGADLVEIGIPFSDPIAEGVTIQAANIRALANGATVDGCFELARRVRAKTDVPLVFLTYLNPVFHRGYEKFFADCSESGVDGVIVPDLPYEEQGEAKPIAAKYGVDLISLIAPTSEARIAEIAKNATGFIYVVSSMGVTGVRSEITTDLKSIIAQIRKVTTVPAAIGFGISTSGQAHAMSTYADGVIVGSAIVKLCEKYGGNAGAHIYEYVKEMKGAVG